MITYETLENGSLTGNGRGSIPPSHRWFAEALAQVAAGDAEILPYVAPVDARTYRDRRQERYIAELSVEGDFQKTTGDMINALFEAHYGDSTKLDALATKIIGIKEDIPET